ncbi:MAG: GGDEF domain-containing protein [Planctomycetota bacterium]|nr:GGDEF domain-containing protein [Planctomycetota bacterium]
MFKLSLGLETELQKVSEEKEELKSSVLNDSLTGLKNRTAYDIHLRSALDYHQRKRKGLSLVVIDVDHFKSVNDTLGHAVGDAVLRQVAETLHATLRKHGTVYRYGGEKLAAILTDCRQTDVEHVAERLRSAIEAREIQELGERNHVTVSIGACYIAGEDHPQNDVFERADRALYEAKESGRNRYIIHSTSEIVHG